MFGWQVQKGKTRYPVVSSMSWFANVSFANVSGRLANVLSRFANVLLVNLPKSK